MKPRRANKFEIAVCYFFKIFFRKTYLANIARAKDANPNWHWIFQ
jgi:predicted transcriptional regulator with HTH domain